MQNRMIRIAKLTKMYSHGSGPGDIGGSTVNFYKEDIDWLID